MESFEHIGFLLHFGDKGSDVTSLSQATPFFNPDMPAVPVPASQVTDWLLKNIASALESISDIISGKESGPSNASDQADCDALNKVSSNDRGPCIVEGVSKTSLFKQASDLNGRSVKVRTVQLLHIFCSCGIPHFFHSCMHVSFTSLCILQVANCHDSVIYLLAPLRYATVYGCSDSTIVLGAAGKVWRIYFFLLYSLLASLG